MASESGTKSFAAALIQIHLTSILAAITVQSLTGILHSLAIYLVSLHILAVLTYILDVRNGRVLKAIFQRLKQKIRPDDRRYSSNLENGLCGI